MGNSLYDPYKGIYTTQELSRIRKFLKMELDRSFQYFSKKANPRIYFLSYLFRNHRYEKIGGRLGSVNDHSITSENMVFCDPRVGSYKYDNIVNGGLDGNEGLEDIIEYTYMPAELVEDAYRYSLWKLTDARYRAAAEEYYDKKTRELHYLDTNKKLTSRLKQKPSKRWNPQTFTEIDTDYWKSLIRKAGKIIKKYPAIKSSWAEFISQHRQSIFMSSEGHEILQQKQIFELRFSLWLLNEKGEGISSEFSAIEGSLDHLPDEDEFLKILNQKIELLFQLEKAPRLNSYSGPVMMDSVAAGLFFHEVIGHRLEGSRLLSPDEGATFMDLKGKKIAPDFINILDDPGIDNYRGRQMIGHYLYDDEGSAAKKAVLVEKGILKNFLTTSSSIPGQKELNGHARNQQLERPISRMGNLCVENINPVSREEMKELFIKEIINQKKPYGIYIKETMGGETGTSNYDFQAFKGEIMHAVRVFPDGREEPVRGVDFVGTPLSALDSVICMGDTPELDNAYCGAESGVVPVSTISPSMLMKNLELQSKDRERFAPYSLPLPYDK
ncbi:MAG: TldD/PmbA family protein [Spirochaetia bacterium]|nr:TldD/PmbA family protein [Spirochaetia bacterium]